MSFHFNPFSQFSLDKEVLKKMITILVSLFSPYWREFAYASATKQIYLCNHYQVRILKWCEKQLKQEDGMIWIKLSDYITSNLKIVRTQDLKYNTQCWLFIDFSFLTHLQPLCIVVSMATWIRKIWIELVFSYLSWKTFKTF